MPPLALRRPKESVIARADRAREAGQWDAAARLYRTALDRNARKPAIWIQYGHALKELGDLRGAEAAYRRRGRCGAARQARSFAPTGRATPANGIRRRGSTRRRSAAIRAIRPSGCSMAMR